MDGRTLLVLGDAGEGQPCVLREAGLYKADRRRQAPPDVDDKPIPQLGGMCMPQHMCGVVVAVDTDRLADNGSVRGVDGSAADRTAVFADAAATAGTAPFRGPMDRAEGRGGEGDEEPRAVANRVGDVLASEEARADEVIGVSGMEAGAGGANGCASVAAADEEAFTGLIMRVVMADDLAGGTVECGG